MSLLLLFQPPDTTSPNVTSSNTYSIQEGASPTYQFIANENVTWSKVSGSSLVGVNSAGTLTFTGGVAPAISNSPLTIVVKATDTTGNQSSNFTLTITITMAPVGVGFKGAQNFAADPGWDTSVFTTPGVVDNSNWAADNVGTLGFSAIIRLYNFGFVDGDFTGTDRIITGIELEVTDAASIEIFTSTINLSKDAGFSTSPNTDFSTVTNTSRFIGGPNDKWGYSNISIAEITSSDFSVTLSYHNDGFTPDTILLDAVRMKVYYTYTSTGGATRKAVAYAYIIF